MQFLVSAVIGIVGLYTLAVGGYHLVYGSWFPFFPPPAVEAYNLLQSGFGASFKMMAIVLMIFGGLASFFAFLLYPHQKAG